MNLGEVLEERARRNPTRVALFHDGGTVTFDELNKRVNRLANGLKDLGIVAGDSVAIMLPNVPEFVYAFFACQKLGAVAVPVNTLYKGGELRHILQDCGATCIITLTSNVPFLNEIKPDVPSLTHVITTGERNVVCMDPDSTFFVQAVLARSCFDSLEDAFQRTGDALVEGLRGLGVLEPWYKHRGSVRVGSRKLAGFYFSEVRDLYVLHAVCFLAPFDPTDFLSVIWIPPEVRDKVVEPLTSIAEETGRIPSFEETQTALIKAFETHLDVTWEEGTLVRGEIRACRRYRRMTHVSY